MKKIKRKKERKRVCCALRIYYHKWSQKRRSKKREYKCLSSYILFVQFLYE